MTLGEHKNSKLNLLEQLQNSSKRFEIILCTNNFKTETGGTISKSVETYKKIIEQARNENEMPGTDFRGSGTVLGNPEHLP